MGIYKVTQYKETDSMYDLISDNYFMLLIINRFKISLGFGQKTIGEVCKLNNVNTDTFLSVTNLLLNKDYKVNINKNNISLPDLLSYLITSHSIFLNNKLPDIRERLLIALGDKNKKNASSIMNFYDNYVAEVTKHMKFEEETVFPYINSVINGEIYKENYSIKQFSDHHENINIKLNDLRNIIIRYYPVKSSIELNNVLYDMFNCSEDLSSHNNIEDSILIPLIKKIEKQR